MRTVEIQGHVPTAAAYLKFSDGQNTAYSFLTTESNTGSYIFSMNYIQKAFFQGPLARLNKTINNSFSPGQVIFLQ